MDDVGTLTMEEIVLLYGPETRKLAASYGSRVGIDGDDLYTAGILAIHKAMPRWNADIADRARFATAMAFGGIRHEARRMRRQFQRETGYAEIEADHFQLLQDPAPSIEHLILEGDFAERLWSMVDRCLAGSEANVLRLKYGRDMTLKEVGETIGRPVSWVSTQHRNGLARLLNAVRQEGVGSNESAGNADRRGPEDQPR